MNVNPADCKHVWIPVRWAIYDKQRHVEQLMCEKCLVLLNFQMVVDGNHREDALNDLRACLLNMKVQHDWDTVRAQFLHLLAQGHQIPIALHQMKMTYKLYPPAPPAQTIEGEEPVEPSQEAA